MRTVVVVQARTGSSRLCGKVLLPLAGRPLLQRMLERVLASSTPSEVVVATTLNPADDPIETIAQQADVPCFRGHATDLLDRHYGAAIAATADVVVKIPSDCPLIDPAVIDRVIRYYQEHRSSFDFVSNLHPASYPDGNDVEVMPMASLERAWEEAEHAHEREHTTPFFWERPDRFRIGNVAWETRLDFSASHRWTVDYPEDYLFASAVYEALWTARRPVFKLDDIVDFVARRPEVAAVNARYAGSGWYRSHQMAMRRAAAGEARL